MGLLSEAAEARDRYSHEQGEIDDVWCLYDVEWPRNQTKLREAREKAAVRNVSLAIAVVQSSNATTKPLRIFGENQVDLGGIMRRWRQTSINCSIVTGGSVTAKVYSPESTRWRR